MIVSTKKIIDQPTEKNSQNWAKCQPIAPQLSPILGKMTVVLTVASGQGQIGPLVSGTGWVQGRVL